MKVAGELIRKTATWYLGNSNATGISNCPRHTLPRLREIVLPVSMAELTARFDWSALRIYNMNMPGQNHGILLGTKGWAP
jgi:hypothetical protein